MPAPLSGQLLLGSCHLAGRCLEQNALLGGGGGLGELDGGAGQDLGGGDGTASNKSDGRNG